LGNSARKSRRKPFATLLLCASLCLVLPPPLFCEDSDKTKEENKVLLSIEVHDPPTVKDSKFHFSILYTAALPDKQFKAPLVACGEGVDCKVDKVTPQVDSKQVVRVEYIATVPEESLDLSEITAELWIHDTSGDQLYKRDSKIVDLGFRKHTLESSLDLTKPLTGGSPQDLYLRFRSGTDSSGGKDNWITPALPVVLTLRSKCADFSHPTDTTSKLSPNVKAQFHNSDHTEEFTIQPHLWSSETCEVDVEGSIAGETTTKPTEPFQINVPVKPAYLTALLLALAGALFQHLFGGAVRLVVDAQAKIGALDSPKNGKIPTKEKLISVFVGPTGCYLFSVVLKGVIAFFVAAIMKDPNFLGLTVEKGTFAGFFTLGVFFGFWPIEKLWLKLAERAGVGQPAKSGDTSGTGPVAPLTSSASS
jgi:hypothetical protein